MTAETSIFDRPTEISDELRRGWAARGWPEDILELARAIHMAQGAIEWWVNHQWATIDNIKRQLKSREILQSGTLRVREATWSDTEALADLYASSPEEIGDWEVTVERGPYSFAQFRLQEHVSVTVLEDRGVILAATADASRNSVVGGKRTTVHIASAWRVRKESRGKGYSHLLRTIGGPACGWFGWYNYYFVRSQNFGAMGWIKVFLRDAVKDLPEQEGEVPGIPVSVHHFKPGAGRRSAGVRPATEADLPACLRLINRTHRGCDLFRPYTRDFLEERLNDPSWGAKPPFWVPVYGWPDYYVLEEEGRVVACGGLWDKGANVREVWRHKETGETNTVDCTALMDFGYAAGREDAMVSLIRFFTGKTQELGRSHLTAGIQHLPRLVRAVAPLEPEAETRALHWQIYGPEQDMWQAAPEPKRIYTDVAYW
jgi:hypothetical protein